MEKFRNSDSLLRSIGLLSGNPLPCLLSFPDGSKSFKGSIHPKTPRTKFEARDIQYVAATNRLDHQLSLAQSLANIWRPFGAVRAKKLQVALRWNLFPLGFTENATSWRFGPDNLRDLAFSHQFGLLGHFIQAFGLNNPPSWTAKDGFRGHLKPQVSSLESYRIGGDEISSRGPQLTRQWVSE